MVFQGVNQNDSNHNYQVSKCVVVITTETIFDDTDIAHLLFDNIEVGNFQFRRLAFDGRPDENLVVKFSGLGINAATKEPVSRLRARWVTRIGSRWVHVRVARSSRCSDEHP